MCSLVQQESWRVTSHHYMCRGMAYDDPAAASCTTSTVAIWHGKKRPRTAHDLFPSTVLVDNKSHSLVSRCNAVVLRNSHSPHRNGYGCGELSIPQAAECPSIVPNATDDDGTNKTSPQLPPFSRQGTLRQDCYGQAIKSARYAMHDAICSGSEPVHTVLRVYCTQVQDYAAERAAYTSLKVSSTEKR